MSKRLLQENAQTVAPLFAKRIKVDSKSAVGSQDEENGLRGDEDERDWKMVCWNVAGLRGLAKKNGHQSLSIDDADLIFLGETKCKEWPVDLESSFKKYHKTLAISTEKNGGYAGVALLSKIKPLKTWQGMSCEEFDKEGRIIFAEFSRFYFVGAYVPNSGRGLVNLEKRQRWEELMLTKINELDKTKPVIYGGDLNVAHEEIDLANPKANRNKTPGFTDQERQWFTDLLENCKLKDTYRTLNPGEPGYTFWSYMGNARAKNVGWRLDYYLVSERVMNKVKSSEIRTNVMGSDHAPIVLNICI